MEGVSTFRMQKGGIMKRFAVVMMAAFLTLTLAGPAYGAGPADHSTSEVFDVADEQPIPGAKARMVRTDSGVGYYLSTSGLTAHHAFTVWWVIFNNPEFCATDPCSVNDLFVEDVDAAVMVGSGHVVGASGHGRFASHLTEGQITTEHPAFTGGPGLTNARGAEIHLVLRSHGPLNPEAMPAQISTFEGGCEVNLDPGTVPSETGECSDLQFAVFK